MGKNQHTEHIPSKLLSHLRVMKLKGAPGVEFVVTSPGGAMLSYEHYCRTLKRYCKKLGLDVTGTHTLRHSTAEIYLENGATRDDIRRLLGHAVKRLIPGNLSKIWV